MLKIIRIIVAIFSIVAMTLLFVDFTGTARTLWPWLAQIQLMPALLSANIMALLFILAMTLLFGRIYCSVICPLGIFQDVVNWMRGRVGSKRKRRLRFKYKAARTRTRLTVLTIFVVLVIIGLFQGLAMSIAGLIEPYSAYGRIATQIFAPAYDGVNNMLAGWSESQPANYMFYRVTAMISIPVLAVAIITLVTVVIYAWTGGRDYCNTICPVGTILGYLSKYSLLKPVIDTSACVNCGKCGRKCKAKCIDTKHHDIDYTRCVACMDCINTCSEGAIHYTWRRYAKDAQPTKKAKKAQPATAAVDQGRRSFMTGAGIALSAVAMEAVAKTTDGGLTALKDKKPAERATRIVPAGAKSIGHLSQHCTACQLCIQNCPNGILKPTLSFDGLMQPHIDYTDGYCPTSCTVCSDICPVGAIERITEADKSAIKIGTAVVDLASCISATEGVLCGNCARWCPVGAIIMVQTVEGDRKSPRMPVVKAEQCIGCGACENHCPVGTIDGTEAVSSAIHVEGIEVHREV